MWPYPRIWGKGMQAKESLAAVLRATRLARGLKAEDFSARIDPTHVNNLENAKVNLTLETLEAVAHVLGVRSMTLLTLAATLREETTTEHFLELLSKEVAELSALGVVESSRNQIENGQLVKRPSGAQISQEKLAAVLECKATGMTQRETAQKLGLPATTVHRYWHKK